MRIEIKEELSGKLLLEGDNDKQMQKELLKLQKKHKHIAYLVNDKVVFSIVTNF